VNHIHIGSALATGAAVLTPALAQTAGVSILYPPPGYSFQFFVRVSGDGETVAGNFLGQPYLFKWRRDTGMEWIRVPEGMFSNTIDDVSYDGSVVVGSLGDPRVRGFRLGPAGEFTVWNLGYWTRAHSCSPDGQWVAGAWWEQTLVSGLFRWSPTTGTELLPAPPATESFCQANGILQDGSAIVGACYRFYSMSGPTIFRWTLGGGTTALAGGWIYDATPDQNVMVGRAYIGAYFPARWTAKHSFHPLGPVGIGLPVHGVSADGWVAVIDRTGPTWDPGPDIWDPVNGIRNLRHLLAELGAPELQTMQGVQVWDISDDGTVIVGSGAYPGGPLVIWRAELPAFCYANCDGSTTSPALNVADFSCFLQKFVADDIYANCNNDAHLNIADFTCFLQKFAQGCP
jgi:hypothetical protein